MARIVIFLIFNTLNILRMSAVMAFQPQHQANKITNHSLSGNFSSHLPEIIKPMHYDIKLILIDSDNFYGETNISLEVYERTRNISFHSDRLGINHQAIVLATGDNGTIYTPIEYSYDVQSQINNVYFNDWLIPKTYYIFLKFTGTISSDANDRKGFFKSSYISTKNGLGRIWLIATFFRGIGARRVFPCWDEPALKATFRITIKHPKHYSALSNVELKQRVVNLDETVWSRFSVTPLMSPYHVTIVLYDWSSFRAVKTKDESIHMLCPAFVDDHNVEYALTIAEGVTQYLRATQSGAEWWRVSKLLHIAVPNFPVEGIDNNALALYRVADVVYNERSDTTDHQLEIARLVSRKVVYHWLGNAFNPYTWSYLWIGESLCTLLAMNALAENRKLQLMDYFIVQMQHESLHLDTRSIMDPLIMDVGPSQSDALFSFQYYYKAPLIMRMVESIMTRNVFWHSVRKYLNEESADTSDDRLLFNFWNRIQDNLKYVSGLHPRLIDLNNAMISWTTCRSYPVLNVTRNYETGQTTVELSASSDISDSNEWYIYVTYATETNPVFIHDELAYKTGWFKSSDTNYTFNADDVDDWIIINLRQTGYYRVQYDNRNWKRLARYLKTCEYDKIHVLNRAQIIDDAYHLMMRGHVNFSLFMDLTEFLGINERDYVAWYPMIKAFEYMSGYFPYPGSIEIQAHMRYILSKAMNDIKYKARPREDELTKCLRQETARWTCVINNEGCKAQAFADLNRYLEDREHYEFVPGMKEWTFCNGLKLAGSQIWYQVLDMWRAKRDKRILQLLACSEDADIICNYLKLPMSDGNITKMNPVDHANSFLFIVARHARNDAVLKFILDNFPTVKPEKVSAVAAFAVIINYVYSEQQLNLIKEIARNEVHDAHEFLVKEKIEQRLRQIGYQTASFERLTARPDRHTG